MNLKKRHGIALVVGLLVVVIGSGAAIYWPTLKVKLYSQSAWNARQAEDWELAVEWYEKVLHERPDDPFTIRQLAMVSENLSGKKALNWWERLNQLQPENEEVALQYATRLMEAGQSGSAYRVLYRHSDRRDLSADFHFLYAQTLEKKKLYPEAEFRTREGLKSEPVNLKAKLMLYRLLLVQREKEKATETQALTAELFARKETAVSARRELLQSALGYAEVRTAWTMAVEINQLTQFQNEADVMKLIYIAARLDEAALNRALKASKTLIQKKPVILAKVTNLLIVEEKAESGLSWMKDLPEEVQETIYPKISEVQFLVALDQMELAMDKLEAGGPWGKNELIRQALLAWVEKLGGDPLASKQRWDRILKRIGREREVQVILMAAMKTWADWSEETAELLWDIYENEVYADIALASLKDLYETLSDPHGLMRLSRELMHDRPDQLRYELDFIYLSLLLEIQTQRAHERAAELYQKQPKQLAIAVNYALSQYRQEEPEAALVVLDSLETGWQSNALIQFYRAVFLAASGRKAEAAALYSGAYAQTLMEQEQRLFQDAIK
ncbi:MAG: CDC27 family protein [Verrucomicrobiota bacterium]